MKLGIAGQDGRVGRLLAVEIPAAGATLVGGVGRGGDFAALASRCDAVIDFTRADAVIGHARTLAAAGVGWVLGTTGLDEAAQDAVRHAAGTIAIVQAANFSPGVTLMLALAERAARALPGAVYDADILDVHHRQKIDAPSGTALALGHAVAAGRGAAFAPALPSGTRQPGAIGFATQRSGQVVGEHTLSFTSAAEQIGLSHRAFDRAVFAAGAVRAALWLVGRAPGFYSMRDVLGL